MGRRPEFGLLIERYCALLVAALATLAMFLPDFGRAAAWHRLAFCGWLASTSGAGVAVVRVLLILATILHQAATEPKS